jgi:hypothetical protein
MPENNQDLTPQEKAEARLSAALTAFGAGFAALDQNAHNEAAARAYMKTKGVNDGAVRHARVAKYADSRRVLIETLTSSILTAKDSGAFAADAELTAAIAALEHDLDLPDHSDKPQKSISAKMRGETLARAAACKQLLALVRRACAEASTIKMPPKGRG